MKTWDINCTRRCSGSSSSSHAAERAEFRFREGALDLRMAVTRAEFEGWIARGAGKDRAVRGWAAGGQRSGCAGGGPCLSDRGNVICASGAADLRDTLWPGAGAYRQRVHLGGQWAGPAGAGDDGAARVGRERFRKPGVRQSDRAGKVYCPPDSRNAPSLR